MTRRHRSSNAKGGKNTTKRPLTHFLALPIVSLNSGLESAAVEYRQGHHESLQETVSAFTNGLLAAKPTLPGLDRTIVIAPRRLHLTLGVMSLEDSSSSNIETTSSKKTLSEALSLLSSLQPQISDLLHSTCLRIPLQRMDIMPPDGGNPDKAHVLWLGPSFENEDAQRLRQVSELVNKTFATAGFISDRRPLKLHCTILNTTYRRPRSGGRREPFSYRSLLGSAAAQTFLQEPQGEVDWHQPVNVDFGTWHVDEIQICKMGSYGPEGEYESCGGLALSLSPP